MPRFLPFQRFLLPLIWVALVLLTVLSVVRAVNLAYGERGGWDLHPYWFYGHFVRAGMNPLEAFAQESPLPRGLRYIDGSEAVSIPASATGLGQFPANTASYLFMLAPLSFLPWTMAKTFWLICNFLLMLAMPWLALRLLPPSLQLSRPLAWLTAFSFYAMKAPRIILYSGQTTLLIFALMIATLQLRKRHWFWAGLALGLALGKYSLAIPLFLFVLYERRFRVLAVAVAVQLLAFVGITAMGNFSPVQTGQVYLTLLAHHFGRNGVHLGYLLRDFPMMANLLIAVGTLIVLLLVWGSYQRGWLAADLLPVMSALSLWALLPAYHGSHDTVLVMLFLILCLSAATTWQLPPDQAQRFGLLWLVAFALMTLPGEFITPFAPPQYEQLILNVIEGAMTVAIVAMLGINLWLLPRVPRVNV